MFKNETTSDILCFLNFLSNSKKVEDLNALFLETLAELKRRSPILACLYEYRLAFGGE